MRALDAGRFALARRLIVSPQVRVGTAAGSGVTALHIAAARGQAEAARMLLLRGADPSAQDAEGNQQAMRVHEVREASQEIVLDLNHPLAGKALLFDVKIVSIE